ncbi:MULTISPECIES: hypothetical protein [unclassified Bradyrhizobium]|uniref:hypothetical protein n=1 Tax=unclassified Bradyrhizobium TaxID=2631580 RepID=UPI0028E9DF43|nr:MULTISPECIES: hypothetical protein [unclassified Bradyrhizobium]
MSMRTQISAMVFMMVQAVLFGAGVLTILLTPLSNHAMLAMPVMIALSVVLSAIVSWQIAPRLRARYWRRRGIDHDLISG